MENNGASPDSAVNTPTSPLQNGNSPGPFHGKATAEYVEFGTNGLVARQQ